MAVADVEVCDVVAEADKLEPELVVVWEEVWEEVEEEIDVVKEVDAVVEEVTTAHWPFWHS